MSDIIKEVQEALKEFAMSARIWTVAADHPEAPTFSRGDCRVWAERFVRAGDLITRLQARAETAETALEAERAKVAAMTKERDEAEAELVGAFEAAADAVEELSKASGTTWGQVKGHIRAMGDVGDRRAYHSLRAEIAAERAKVAKLVEALTPLTDHTRDRRVDDPAWRDKDCIMVVVTVGELSAAIEAAKVEWREVEAGHE